MQIMPKEGTSVMVEAIIASARFRALIRYEMAAIGGSDVTVAERAKVRAVVAVSTSSQSRSPCTGVANWKFKLQ